MTTKNQSSHVIPLRWQRLPGGLRRVSLLASLAVLAGVGAGGLQAATRTWTGGGTDFNWNTPANWDSGVPATGDSVVFPSGVTKLASTNNISGLSLSGLSFSGTGFLLGGTALTNMGGITDSVGYNTNAIVLTLGAAQAINNTSPGSILQMSSGINSTNFALTIGGDGDVYLNGVVAGDSATSLTKNGYGTLRLGAANTFAGGLTINAGTARVANGTAIPTGAGRGDVTLASGATLDLNANSQSVNGLYGAGMIDNQTGTGTYTLTVGNNSTNSAGNFTGTINQSSGTIALNKVNTNTFTLNGTSSHSGRTTVSAGTLALGPLGYIGSSSGYTINPGAALDVSANSSFYLTGSQGFTAGRATNGGPADVNGTLNLYGGVVTIYKAAAPGTLTINGGLNLTSGTFTFDLGNTSDLAANDVIGLNGPLSLGPATFMFNPLAGSFASTPYLLISNASSTVSGATSSLITSLPRGLSISFDATSHPGSLYATFSGAARPATLVWKGASSTDWDVQTTKNWQNGGTLDYFMNVDNVVFEDAGPGTVNVATGVSPTTTTFNNVATNYILNGSGAISGPGTLTVNSGGTVTLNTPNSYTGDTIVNNGSTLISGVLAGSPHITLYNGVPTPGNLVLGGGHFFLSDNQTDTYRANFGNLVINPGAASLGERNRQSSSSYIIQFSAVTRNGVGGTVDFNNIQSKSSSPQCGLLITNMSPVNGMLGGFATIWETDWVVPISTNAGSIAYAAYTTSTSPSNWQATNNVALTASTSSNNVNTTTINSLKLTGPATVTINGGQSLTLSSGGLLVPVNAGGASTITGGSLLGGAGADLIVHQFHPTYALTVGSVIADNGSATALTKSGQGTLVLTGTNTYTGPTYINGPTLRSANNNTPGTFSAGTLQLGNGGTSGSIDTSSGITNSGTLAFNRSDAITFALPISGSGGVKVASGSVTLTGNNAYRGTTTIGGGGTLQVGNGGTAGSLGNSSSIANGGALVFNRSDALLYPGAISGLGSLTQQGSGTLTLSGANTYSGNTTVSAGTLALGGGGSLSNSVQLLVNSGAVLDVSAAGGLTLNGAANQFVAGNGTVRGIVSTSAGSRLCPGGDGVVGTLTFANDLVLNGGSVSIDISSSTSDLVSVGGNLALTAGMVQLNIMGGVLPNGTYRLISYTGSRSGSAGNLTLSGFSQPGQIANLVDGVGGVDLVVSSYTAANMVWHGDGVNNTWDMNTTANWLNGATASVFHNFDNAVFDDTGSSTPAINLVGALTPSMVTVNAAKDYTFSGNGRIDGGAGLVKQNTGTLNVLTTNDYTGPTTISGGTVVVGNGTVSGSLGAGNITDNAALVFNQPDSREVSGNLSGSGTLTQQGAATLTLVGNNSSFSGSITIASGTLQVGDGGSVGTLGSGPVINNTTLTVTRNGALPIGSAISGTGTVIVDGLGTVTLSGANSYQGNTYVSNGIVKLGASEVIPDGGATTGWLVLDGSPTVAGTLDLNGFNETVNGLAGVTGTALGKIVNNGGSGTNTLTVNSIADTTFYGLIQDNSGSGGKVALVKDGANTLTLRPDGLGSTYSGGTSIRNGILSGGSSTTANANMVGSGPVTFTGSSGILQLAGWTGSTSPDYSTFANPLVLGANVSGTVYGTCRGGFSPSSVTGPANSTLTFVTRYVRGNVGGNWSGFNGMLIVSNNTTSAGNDFRVNTAAGFPNARVYLAAGGGGGAYVYNIVSGNPIIPIGELTGDATASIALNSGSASGAAARWCVGGLNTTAQYDGGITDTHGIIKVGTGTWTLTSANLTYTGPTVVSNGVLAFSATAAQPPSSMYSIAAPGKLDISNQGTLTVANWLEGNGTLQGSLSVNGTVRPGFTNTPGVLTVSGSGAFASLNGTTLINLNRTNSLNCGRLAAPSILCGGTLTVSNIGPSLVGGESFQLFSGTLSGTFAATNLPALAPGLSWDTSSLGVNGTLKVAGSVILPQMGSVQVQGSMNVITAGGGSPGATFTMLTSTNLTLPLSSWTSLGTGVFAADGSCSFTNTSATNAVQFYKLAVPLQ